MTPRHITDLFARLANVDKSSTVLDPCAGTGGFLVSAMHFMMRSAVTEAERARIRDKGLVGIENQPNMYALAASNMILRGTARRTSTTAVASTPESSRLCGHIGATLVC